MVTMVLGNLEISDGIIASIMYILQHQTIIGLRTAMKLKVYGYKNYWVLTIDNTGNLL